MLNKHLVSTLVLMMPILSNPAMAVDILGQVVKDGDNNPLDRPRIVYVKWQWSNQDQAPFNLKADTTNWWITDLIIDPGKKENVWATAFHIVPPHGESVQWAPLLCFEQGKDPRLPSQHPSFGSKPTICSAKIWHNKKNEHFDYHYVIIKPPEAQNGQWSAEWRAIHCGGELPDQGKLTSNNEFPTCPTEPPLSSELTSFQSTSIGVDNHINWVTSSEIDPTGFRLWRGTKNKHGKVNITILRGKELTNQTTECIEGNLIVLKTENESGIETCQTIECIEKKLRAIEINNQGIITARGSEREETCYSYIDTNINNENDTYYYLLEDLDANGDRTFHWDFLEKVD